MSSNRSTPDNGNDASAAATNSDAANDATNSSSKASVRKDRNCPFCHQAFTSSSLGRHLDSFIRDKSPKPQDGVHDLQKIRRMRENITRRHTRVPPGAVVDNSSRRWSVTSIVSPKSGPRGQISLLPPPKLDTGIDPSIGTPGYDQPVSAPAPNWMVTGVINNLPPRGYASPLPRILPRPESSMPQGTQAFSNVEDIDDARAAEQALREVLDVVRSAAASIEKPALFDFDFYACNFPALCIRLLQAPAALFSTTPLPGPASWPVGVPSQAHHAALQEQLRKKVLSLQDKHDELNAMGANADSRRPSHANVFYQPEYKSLFDHLDVAYQHWQSLSEGQKHEVWQLETLRAYAQEVEQRQSMQLYVMRLQNEAEALRAQLEEFASKKQSWQPGADVEPPRSIGMSLPKNLVQAINKTGIDLNEWDFDKLIAKYKPSVQKARRQSASGTNDIRTAHERALSTFGPSDSMLLRPIVGGHGVMEGPGPDNQKNGQAPSDMDDDSQDGDGEFDADIDMDDGPGHAEEAAVRGIGRHGPG